MYGSEVLWGFSDERSCLECCLLSCFLAELTHILEHKLGEAGRRPPGRRPVPISFFLSIKKDPLTSNRGPPVVFPSYNPGHHRRAVVRLNKAPARVTCLKTSNFGFVQALHSFSSLRSPLLSTVRRERHRTTADKR